MGCEVVGLLLKDAIQMRDGMCTGPIDTPVVPRLRVPPNVGSDAQRFVKRSKASLFLPSLRKRRPQHPEPGIFGRLLANARQQGLPPG